MAQEYLKTPQYENPFSGSSDLIQYFFELLTPFDIKPQIHDARENWYKMRGKPVPGDPFFDAFMTNFMEWFLIERKCSGNFTPLELISYKNLIQDHDIKSSLYYLATSHHSLFEIMSPWKEGFFWLRDLYFHTDFVVSNWPPFPGIDPGQVLEGRVVFHKENLYLSPSVTIFPFHTREEIEKSVKILISKNISISEIINLMSDFYIRSCRYPSISTKRFFNLEDPIIKDIMNRHFPKP